MSACDTIVLPAVDYRPTDQDSLQSIADLFGVSLTRIIAAAEQADVPLYPDAELALVLSQVPMGDEIPDNLYKAIAEVIAFAYALNDRLPSRLAARSRGEASAPHARGTKEASNRNRRVD